MESNVIKNAWWLGLLQPKFRYINTLNDSLHYSEEVH